MAIPEISWPTTAALSQKSFGLSGLLVLRASMERSTSSILSGPELTKYLSLGAVPRPDMPPVSGILRLMTGY